MFIGKSRACNVADMISLIIMMGDAYINGITHLNVFGDNEIIIKFMSGNGARGLTKFTKLPTTLTSKFENISFTLCDKS